MRRPLQLQYTRPETGLNYEYTTASNCKVQNIRTVRTDHELNLNPKQNPNNLETYLPMYAYWEPDKAPHHGTLALVLTTYFQPVRIWKF